MNIFDKAPVVDKDAFVAPSASIIGDVQVGRASSIWYGCVLRGKILLYINSVVYDYEIGLPFYFFQRYPFYANTLFDCLNEGIECPINKKHYARLRHLIFVP